MRQNIRADICLRLSGPNEGSPAFSPSEAITISGIAAERLFSWYRRNVLPVKEFPTQGPGQGNHRRYTLGQITILAVAHELIELGVPVGDAFELARFHPPFRAEERIHPVSLRVLGALRQARESVSAADLTEKIRNEKSPWLIVFRAKGKLFGAGVSVQVASEFGIIDVPNSESVYDLECWTRRMRLTGFSIIDWPMIAGHILARAWTLATAEVVSGDRTGWRPRGSQAAGLGSVCDSYELP
jgi:DNA-binding transcriptional MerR regulator